MKRLFASFLLCLAMLALPVPRAAAVTMACSVTQAVGLSMPERHAAIKAEAEAELGHIDHTRCQRRATGAGDDTPVWHDMQPSCDTPNHPGGHQRRHAGSTCNACAACTANALVAYSTR